MVDGDGLDVKPENRRKCKSKLACFDDFPKEFRKISYFGMRSIPNFRRRMTVIQKKPVVRTQFAPRADQNDQPLRSIQGRIRNMGRVGRTNQKVPSACPAIFPDGCPPFHIPIIASRDVSGTAISSAES